MTLEDKEKTIIEHYGVLPQLKYFYSEIFELTEAIINYETTETGIAQIVEEIGDVQMMLNQFKRYYGISDITIDMLRNKKANRQLGRIEKENEQRNTNRQTDC